MISSPQTALKVIVVGHFVLTVWASMSGCLFGSANASYVYMSAFILSFGVWAIVCPESADAIFMFFILTVTSIIMEIVFISVHAPNDGKICQLGGSLGDTYRFSLGMAITNLILKPLTGFILYRIYQDRTGVNMFPEISIGDHSRTSRGYSNIDQNTSSTRNVETASPYATVDKLPVVS